LAPYSLLGWLGVGSLAEWGNDQLAAQPRLRADRPPALLVGTLAALPLGGGSRRTLGLAMDAPLACSFCGKTQDEVRKLISGPSVFICDGCVLAAVREMIVVTRENSVSVADAKPEAYYCAFCGKSHAEVKCLAAGPGALICNECLTLSFDYMVGEKPLQRVVRFETKA